MDYLSGLASQIGETATLKYETSKSINKYGDADETRASKDITAVFEFFDAESDEVREGEYEEGDIRFYIDDSEDKIQVGAIVEYDGKSYKIDEVQLQRLNASSGHYEVRARQV